MMLEVAGGIIIIAGIIIGLFHGGGNLLKRTTHPSGLASR